MGWTAGANKAAGDIITHTIWNNYMGAAGSLEYLYALAGSGGSIPTQAESTGKDAIQSAAGDGTKGAYTELIASTAFASMYLYVHVYGTAPGAGEDYDMFLDIATGAAASEAVKIPDIYLRVPASGDRYIFCFPFSIPIATRIAARFTNHTNAYQYTNYISLTILG